MAGIVDNRIRLWELVHEVTSRPDQHIVDRLSSGEWIDDVRQAVQWLGEAADRFAPGLTAAEKALEEDAVTLESLMAAHDSIDVRRPVSLSETLADLGGQLAAERRAWASGDDEYAKTLRLAQHDQLHTRVVPAIQQWSSEALHQQHSPVLTALVRVVTVVLSMETGRDFERRLGGGEFSITDDLPIV